MNAIVRIVAAEEMDVQLDDDWLVIMAHWDDELDNKIYIQDFVLNGESYIPLFSGVDQFKRETFGSEFYEKGVMIKREILLEILRGDEIFILNPRSDNPIRLYAKDI